MTKRIRRVEVDGQPNASLVFVDEHGADAETIFVGYIPVSMVKDLMKDKKWIDDKNEEL